MSTCGSGTSRAAPSASTTVSVRRPAVPDDERGVRQRIPQPLLQLLGACPGQQGLAMEVGDRLEGRVPGGVEAGVDVSLQPPSQWGEEDRGASGHGDGDGRTAPGQHDAGQDVGRGVHGQEPGQDDRPRHGGHQGPVGVEEVGSSYGDGDQGGQGEVGDAQADRQDGVGAADQGVADPGAQDRDRQQAGCPGTAIGTGDVARVRWRGSAGSGRPRAGSRRRGEAADSRRSGSSPMARASSRAHAASPRRVAGTGRAPSPRSP